MFTLPNTRNGRAYVTYGQGSGTSVTGASEPTWPTITGDMVLDNTITWEALAPYWEPATSYATGYELYPYNGHKYTSDGGGATGATEPFWSRSATTVTDGAITWTRTSVGKDIDAASLPARPQYLERWKTKMSRCLITAGIDPKSDSTPLTQGGACWTDTGDQFYWADPTGYYLPMFNGVYYISSKLKDGAVISTKEFGFAPVAGCPDKLQVGDKLIIAITGAGSASTYQLGDKFVIPIVAASNAYLTGGVTGDDTHTWGVTGSTAGVLPDYSVVHGAELPYSAGGVGFAIYRGGLANALGDRWTFDVLGGQFRWRRDAGAWSAPADIDASATSMGDGLSLTFTPNKAPSFVAGETYAWDVLQPYAPSEAVDPNHSYGWQWIGATATLTADLGSAQDITALGLVHRLPSGATLTLEGSDDNFASTDWAEAIPIDAAAHLTLLAQPRTSRYLRLGIAGGGAGSVLWAWAGVPLQPPPYSDIAITRRCIRTAGRVLRGAAVDVSLDFGILPTSPRAALVALLDAITADDLPVLFAPQIGEGYGYDLPHVFGRASTADVRESLFRPGVGGVSFGLEGVML